MSGTLLRRLGLAHRVHFEYSLFQDCDQQNPLPVTYKRCAFSSKVFNSHGLFIDLQEKPAPAVCQTPQNLSAVSFTILKMFLSKNMLEY